MSATSVRKLSRKAHADRAVCGTRQRWCWRTKKVGSGEIDDEVVRDAAHLAKRKDERQHGHVACDRRDEQRNVDADERRRLAVRVRVQTITELGHEPPHQPLGVQQLTCRRLRVQTVTELCHKPPHQPLGVQHFTCRRHGPRRVVSDGRRVVRRERHWHRQLIGLTVNVMFRYRT